MVTENGTSAGAAFCRTVEFLAIPFGGGQEVVHQALAIGGPLRLKEHAVDQSGADTSVGAAKPLRQHAAVVEMEERQQVNAALAQWRHVEPQGEMFSNFKGQRGPD